MASVIQPDEIDFGAYMDMTDSAHKVRPASEFVDAVIEKLYGQGQSAGAALPWSKTHGQFKARPGEVTVWTGWNGHKKSMIIGQVILGFCQQGEKSMVASMEMRPESTLARMSKQASGGDEPSIKFIREFHAWTDGKLWLYNHLGQIPWGKMVAVCKYSAEKLGINHIVIDSLMKCGIGEDDYNGQKNFLDALCVVARDLNVHIHLVAHSKKGADEDKPPNKMDTKGTGTITDLVDNVIVVWTNKKKDRERLKPNPNAELMSKPDQFIVIEKQRNGEHEGMIGLWFHDRSLQFVGKEGGYPMSFLSDEPPVNF
jgi:twinkle protein